MALNPDALNLNYDSDDSMQVDSENEQVNNHHIPVDNVQDPDPDADADGDAEDVDDTTSLAIAGPSSYTPKGSDVEESGYEDNVEEDDEDEDDGSYADDEYGKKKAPKKRKKEITAVIVGTKT